MTLPEPYYQEETVRLYCGDNVAVMSEFPDDYVDMTCTSPPYGNLRSYSGTKPIGEMWDFEGVAQQLWRLTKPGGVVVWVVADATVNGSESGESFRQALRFKEIGFRLHDTMIWDKGGFSAVGSCQVRYGPVYEFMFVLTKGPAKAFNPLKDRKNSCVGTDPRSSSVREKNGQKRRQESLGSVVGEFGIRFNIWKITPQSNSVHAAIFPESLARDHILSWSNEGDTVLDCFAGSCTTLKMARKNGRKSVGIEISKDYCAIGRKRLRQQVLAF